MKKKKLIAIIGALCILCIAIVVIIKYPSSKAGVVTSKEKTVEYGTLTVGVTESGSATIGSHSQEFDLDLSGSFSSESGSSTNNFANNNTSENQGHNGMQAAMIGTENSSGVQTSNGASSDSNVSLEVEKVYVSVGQVVEKGEPILQLTKESVAAVKQQLEDNVSSAELALEEAKITRNSTKIEAKYTYEKNLALGTTAKKEYQATLTSLENAVTKAQKAVTDAKARIAKIPSEIAKLKSQKKKLQQSVSAGSVTKTSNASVNISSSSQMDGSSGQMNGTNGQINGSAGNFTGNDDSKTNTAISDDKQSQITSIENQITALENELKNYKNNYSNLVANLTQAKNEQVTGKVTAKEKYQQDLLSYQNAKKLYNIAIDNVDEGVNNAKEECKQAQAAVKEFQSLIGNGTVKSSYAGKIISLGYSAEDTLNSDTAIAIYADESAVNLTVSVSQEDISKVAVGNEVKIAFTAYEDEEYAGTVTEISTEESSSTTSSSTVSYAVTVNVQGDVSKIYEGMTGNVTFVTKEVSNVVYVSNKAIINEGTKSYVLKKQGDTSVKTEVITGFSDGNQVEIKNGLKKGDVVLIENQVVNGTNS